MQLSELRDYIESRLDSGRFKDYCPNGLQIEGGPQVARLATAVTASQAVLEAASDWGADAILVHHGYFWRGEAAPITGIKKRRIAHLLRHNISLLAFHLPLDAHPVWGNNAQLGKLLGFVEHGRYFEQAIALGVDAFLTGEISEQNVHCAEESGVAFIAAGHHATERLGVRALGQHLSAQFSLEHRFFDQQNPI